MKRYFAYTRVSTVRQGEHGVSLQEQKEAIERYAARHGLEIKSWFSEQETAARTGRPVFNQMLRMVKRGQADGIVIHKIDRSARNLKDWAEVGQLVDAGVEVHFANESVDLTSPGGMLSADVQAVVAAYYIRNLREEVKKGYYGRLKQGLCPYPAPLGYLDCGQGKPKAIDPVRGPLIRALFELYATGKYSQPQLTEEMYRLGLRTKKQQKVSENVIARILSNPFYAGQLRIKKANQIYAGIHQPIITQGLFERVRQILSGKFVIRTRSHRFVFSRLITCKTCGRSLIAEEKKGHVYYRCHRAHSSLKEKGIEENFSKLFARLAITPEEGSVIDEIVRDKKQISGTEIKRRTKTEELALTSLQNRITRLTDAYLDGLLDRDHFEQKKTTLLLERREVERRLTDLQSGRPDHAWEKKVELIKTAYSLYKLGFFEEKRQMVSSVMSNRIANGKTLEITVRFPFSEVLKRNEPTSGGAHRGANRNFWKKLISKIALDKGEQI